MQTPEQRRPGAGESARATRSSSYAERLCAARVKVDNAAQLAERAWSLAGDAAHVSGDGHPAVLLDEGAVEFLQEFGSEFVAAESFGHYDEGAALYAARYGSAVLYGSGLAGTEASFTVGYLFGHEAHAEQAFAAFRDKLAECYADRLGDAAGLSYPAAQAAAAKTFELHGVVSDPTVGPGRR